MLKRMVGCAFSSSGSGNNRAGGSAGSSTGSGNQAVLTPQPSAVVAEPHRASPGATSAAPSSNSAATASTTPAWAAPRTATREELEARRIAERKFITANDSTETDVWYLIDVDWLSDWKRFVLRSGPLPGPIRNESLIDSRTGRARLNLELVVNYRGVNAGIWRYWLQRYGGGPVIRRAQLDLYAEIVYDDFAHQGLFGADSALEDAGEPPSDFALAVAGRGPFGPGSGNVASMGNEAFAFEHQSSGTSSGALAERGAAERPEDPAKPGKAGSRRSFSDFLKGYRGGGRSSRSGSLPTAKATDTSTTSSTASSRGAQAPKNKDKDKKEERVDLGGGGSEMSASSSTSSPSDPPGMNFFVKETDACVISQPMDGSCLFHSLSYGIDDGADATSLRLDISNYIAGNPDMVIAGTALKDWIKFDSGGKVAAYAAEMAGGTWGGGIEIEAFVRLKDVNVHVFESCPGGYRRICCFDAALESGDQRGDSRTTVTLLYQGREHYDALVLDRAAGKWVPRTGMAFHAGA